MSKRFRLSFALLVGVVSIISLSERHVESQGPSGGPFVAGEVLIKFRPGANDGAKAAARFLAGAARRRQLRANGSGELELARLPAGRAVANAINALRQHPAVEYAEPNWVQTHQDLPDDPLYLNGVLWGMYGDSTTPANQFGSQAAEAWAAGNTGSATVYVGVIDEGLDLNHQDLYLNIWHNSFDLAGDGVDNDGNGYIDDVHGWDFDNNDNSIYDGSAGNTTIDSHGTHVSGTIGAYGGNGTGVAGVNWRVSLISAKFLGPNGGTTANAVRAIDYFTDLKTRHGLDIVATNNSWGGGGYSQALHEAILRAAKAGILFVAAAGNGNTLGQGVNNDVTPFFPASYDTTTGTPNESPAEYDAVIAVTSLTSSGAKSTWANYGRTTVELGAPGSGIVSTTPNNTYSSYSGTSMATPHVTGAAALYRSMNPGSTAVEVRNAILGAAVATPTASVSGITITNGRLNLGALVPPPPPPLPPSGLGATAGSSSSINLVWADNSGNEDGFQIERCQGAGCSNFSAIGSVGAGVTAFGNTGLSANTSYRYRVRAFNGGGPSLYSNEAAATTSGAPGPPSAPSALTGSPSSFFSRRINLAWADNSGNESGFRIERCQGSSCTNFTQIATVGANVRTFSNTGLAWMQWYRYRVRSYNAAGNSTYSNIVAVRAP